MFSFGAEGFCGREAGSAPGGGKRSKEAGDHHADNDSNERGVGSVPIDGPTEKGAVDDLHEDEGDGEAGDEAEKNPSGTEVGGFGHDRPKYLATGSASGAEDSDFAGAFDSQGGEGKGNAECGDSDGEGSEEGGDCEGAIKNPEGLIAKTGLGVDEKFSAWAKLFAKGIANGFWGDAGFEMNGEAGEA
jgi:hypothetical protein